MAKSKRDQAIEMHCRGMSLKEIGTALGVDTSRAWQLIHYDYPGDRFRDKGVNKVRYVGLRKWMLENRVTIAELSRRAGTSDLYNSLCDDHEPRKFTIDAILRVTGMTYEECFGMEDGGLK